MSSAEFNKSIKSYNTFGIEVCATQFFSIQSEADLVKLHCEGLFNTKKLLVLGAGSNILFTENFNGTIVKIDIPGISTQREAEVVYVTAGGGVVWNDFVQYCVNNNFGGVENLSLIPGTVGASPVQNIGAYGVELMDVFYTCRAFNIHTGEFKIFTKEECAFEYRNSIFKHALKGTYIITEVTFQLYKNSKLNISYGAIASELSNRGITEPTIRDVSEVVSAIRVSKLPDPSMIGNAGSFFKNPLITKNQFNILFAMFPDIVHFPAGADKEKIAAGWLIEKCGFKGVVVGNTGTWKNQALVLVNHGGATGKEVYDFSEQIVEAVYNSFNINLEREVNIF